MKRLLSAVAFLTCCPVYEVIDSIFQKINGAILYDEIKYGANDM